MPLTDTEIDAAVPVDGTPSRSLTNAALKELVVDVAGKASTTHTHTLANITDAGTAAAANTGTSAGNVPVLDGSGRLPAVDGSQLTGLAGGGDMAAATFDPQGVNGDAFARANHTGEQAISTITGLQPAITALQSIVVDARSFGILTSNSASENDTGFVALQTYLHANRSKLVEIYFPQGDINYNWNGWLAGCGWVKVYAHGTNFLNNQASGQAAVLYPLYTPPWIALDASKAKYDDESIVSASNLSYGFLIDTAEANAGTVTLSTLSDASEFSEDDLVFIHGFDRTPVGGAPRNPRYFEYSVITDVNLSTGEITLNKPLRYRYDDTWPEILDAGNTIGAARIAKCRHANHYWPNYIHFVGGNFLDNVNNAGGDNLAISAEVVILEDVKAPHIYGATSRYTYMKNCYSSGVEIDKLIDTFHLENLIHDVRLDNDGVPLSIAAGTGCQNMLIERCSPNLYLSNIGSMEKLHIKNCDLMARPDKYNIAFEVENQNVNSLILEQNHYTSEGDMVGSVVVNEFGPKTLSLESGTSGRDIHISSTHAGIQAIDYGRKLWTKDGRGGRVTAISGSGADFVVNLDSADTFTSSDVLQYNTVSEIIDLGGHSYSAGVVRPHQNPALLRRRNRTISRQEIQFSQDDLSPLVTFNQRQVALFVEKVEVEVLSADTSGEGLTFQIEFDAATNSFYTRWTIDVSQAGVRSANASGTVGALGSDVLAFDFAGNFVNEVRIGARDGGAGGWAAAEPHERAKFIITISGITI